jgi:hypothetical protein
MPKTEITEKTFESKLGEFSDKDTRVIGPDGKVGQKSWADISPSSAKSSKSAVSASNKVICDEYENEHIPDNDILGRLAIKVQCENTFNATEDGIDDSLSMFEKLVKANKDSSVFIEPIDDQSMQPEAINVATISEKETDITADTEYIADDLPERSIEEWRSLNAKLMAELTQSKNMADELQAKCLEFKDREEQTAQMAKYLEQHCHSKQEENDMLRSHIQSLEKDNVIYKRKSENFDNAVGVADALNNRMEKLIEHKRLSDLKLKEQKVQLERLMSVNDETRKKYDDLVKTVSSRGSAESQSSVHSSPNNKQSITTNVAKPKNIELNNIIAILATMGSYMKDDNNLKCFLCTASVNAVKESKLEGLVGLQIDILESMFNSNSLPTWTDESLITHKAQINDTLRLLSTELRNNPTAQKQGLLYAKPLMLKIKDLLRNVFFDMSIWKIAMGIEK